MRAFGHNPTNAEVAKVLNNPSPDGKDFLFFVYDNN